MVLNRLGDIITDTAKFITREHLSQPVCIFSGVIQQVGSGAAGDVPGLLEEPSNTRSTVCRPRAPDFVCVGTYFCYHYLYTACSSAQ